MNVCFDGVGQVCATFLDGGVEAGQVVKITGRGTAGKCSAGDSFYGVALHSRAGACAVQVRGFVTVGYSGTVPGFGAAVLCADGTGGVKTAAAAKEGDPVTGTNCLVADVDTTAKTVTVLL